MPVYKARLSQDPDGSWMAAAVQVPLCWSRGASRDEALAKLRDEIRYRIEYCPCSGVDDEHVRVEVEVAPALAAPQPTPAAGPTVAPAPATRPQGWRRWDD